MSRYIFLVVSDHAIHGAYYSQDKAKEFFNTIDAETKKTLNLRIETVLVV